MLPPGGESLASAPLTGDDEDLGVLAFFAMELNRHDLRSMAYRVECKGSALQLSTWGASPMARIRVSASRGISVFISAMPACQVGGSLRSRQQGFQREDGPIDARAGDGIARHVVQTFDLDGSSQGKSLRSSRVLTAASETPKAANRDWAPTARVISLMSWSWASSCTSMGVFLVTGVAGAGETNKVVYDKIQPVFDQRGFSAPIFTT